MVVAGATWAGDCTHTRASVPAGTITPVRVRQGCVPTPPTIRGLAMPSFTTSAPTRRRCAGGMRVACFESGCADFSPREYTSYSGRRVAGRRVSVVVCRRSAHAARSRRVSRVEQKVRK